MVPRILILCALFGGIASAAEPASKWTITLRYGGGTPNDAGPLGHCTATFKSTGEVQVETIDRQGRAQSELTVYKNKSLKADKLAAIRTAAAAALQEKPYRRLGSNEDGKFLVLERSGDKPVKVGHYQLNNFADAPAGVLELVKLLNELLPEDERIPLAKLNPSAKTIE